MTGALEANLAYTCMLFWDMKGVHRFRVNAELMHAESGESLDTRKKNVLSAVHKQFLTPLITAFSHFWTVDRFTLCVLNIYLFANCLSCLCCTSACLVLCILTLLHSCPSFCSSPLLHPILALPFCIATYMIRNLSEPALTQYELDSKCGHN